MSEHDPLSHNLNIHFQDLARFRSTGEMLNSKLYQQLSPEIDTILNTIDVQENGVANNPLHPCFIRATAWNIERGNEFDRLVEVFSQHPIIAQSDLLFLTELDHGMARSRNRHVARELAGALKMNSAFSPCYINLEKGSGLEIDIAGENHESLHGNALLSRHELRDPFAVRLVNGKDKMKGKEKRLGSQVAVGATVMHPLGAFRAVSIHLDAHSTQKHRADQMKAILDHVDQMTPRLPILLGGDWNTATYNSSNSFYTIMGYWKRVFMGVRNVIQNHFPYPDRYFEKELFRMLEMRGYDYKSLNVPGGCTLHYDVEDLAANGRMADWIPFWCFWFINWALARNNGRCSLKLDWFAGKRIHPYGEKSSMIAYDVHDRERPISDHDPIILDFGL